jgi:metal-sulfur cluster biosynthetic enzyme
MIKLLLIVAAGAVVVAIVMAVRKQARITNSLSASEQSQDARVFAESSRRMEATVQATAAEQLAARARDPRLASMTQEDLVIEVLKDCFDPEIPLNIVDLGLIYGVDIQPDTVKIKVTMTSPMCPSHAAISEDIKVKLDDAGFPNPTVELVWEPAWSPARISEAGRKTLGI